MEGRIPSNINLDKLLKNLKGKNGKNVRKDTYQKLKEGMVYFLTLLTFDINDTEKRIDGYKILNNKVLEEIIGQKRPTVIIRILLENNVIEIRPHKNRNTSSGYRLTQKYCSGDYTYMEYGDRIRNKLNLLKENIEPEYGDTTLITYPYLLEQFKKNDLTVQKINSYRILRSILMELISKSCQKRKYKLETIITSLNITGSYKLKIEDLYQKNYHLKLSSSNLRFSSNLTTLKKELRQFLKVNGKPLVEIDLKSSQPFILSTILNRNFTENTDYGYNLFSIYPELYNELTSLKSFIPTNTPERTEYILGVHFTPESFDQLQNFVNFDFGYDFYDYILTNGRLSSDSLNDKVFSKGRSYVKKHIMNYLFERNEEYKIENLVIRKIDTLYPELSDFINRFLSYYGKRKFSLLLQRTESFLILNKVCGYLNDHFPHIPFFTIHDSVLTTEEYSERVKNIFVSIILEYTNKVPSVTFSNFEDLNIEKIWKKVNIENIESFDRLKYSVTQKNILNGLNLLNDNDVILKTKKIIEPYMNGF